MSRALPWLVPLMFVVATVTAEPRPLDEALVEVQVFRDAGLQKDLFVVRAGRLYIAGQPNATDLSHFKRLGVTTVVNLRNADEMDWNEADAARELGLTYYQVPVASEDGLNSPALDLVDELAHAGAQKTVLIHCRSGNRAAAWWARHLVNVHNVQPGQALVQAGRAGLTHPRLVEEVKALLN